LNSPGLGSDCVFFSSLLPFHFIIYYCPPSSSPRRTRRALPCFRRLLSCFFFAIYSLHSLSARPGFNQSFQVTAALITIDARQSLPQTSDLLSCLNHPDATSDRCSIFNKHSFASSSSSIDINGRPPDNQDAIHHSSFTIYQLLTALHSDNPAIPRRPARSAMLKP